jgi:hypothetical protein
VRVTHNKPMHLHREKSNPETSIKNKQEIDRSSRNRRAAQLGRYEKKYKDVIERITMPPLPWEEQE